MIYEINYNDITKAKQSTGKLLCFFVKLYTLYFFLSYFIKIEHEMMEEQYNIREFNLISTTLSPFFLLYFYLIKKVFIDQAWIENLKKEEINKYDLYFWKNFQYNNKKRKEPLLKIIFLFEEKKGKPHFWKKKK